MKKSKWLFLCFCLVASLVFAVAAFADALGDWTYTKTDDGIAIVKCDPSAREEVTVPHAIGDVPVTSIMFSAFRDCENITGIVIPSSVKSIGEYAFTGCKSLQNITVDAANPYFCSDAQGVLYNKNGTELLRCPEGKTACIISFPITEIGWAAFENCALLESLVLPSSVTSIKSDAFNGCAALTSIVIPASVTNIGWGAFDGCGKLCNNTGDLIYIQTADNPCYYLLYTTRTSLTSCEISPYCKFIARRAFADCENLADVTLPSGVLGIGDFAFADCASLTSVTIPAGVPSIGQNTFYGCKNLREVTFAEPSRCKSVGAYAFGGCDALSDVYYFGTEDEWNAIDVSAESVTQDGVAVNNDALLRAEIHFAYPLEYAMRSDAVVLAIGKLKAWVFGSIVQNDVAPKIVRDRTMVPIRFIAEALGAKVDWNFDGVARKAIVQKGDKTIEIMIDSMAARVNGSEVILDSPAFIENDRTYLPLRFVAEALDAKVEWVADVREIIITP
ncbi:MAG: leucine-rich repeat protein [Clostridia bacterium]|nr:leucine-rich repeat protein [Clostridia bacterium]